MDGSCTLSFNKITTTRRIDFKAKNKNNIAMKVFHISAECYPVAKTGGLGDVVGALPKYQNLLGIQAAVIMPWYDKPFVRDHKFEKVYESEFKQGSQFYSFTVLKESTNVLGFRSEEHTSE